MLKSLDREMSKWHNVSVVATEISKYIASIISLGLSIAHVLAETACKSVCVCVSACVAIVWLFQNVHLAIFLLKEIFEISIASFTSGRSNILQLDSLSRWACHQPAIISDWLLCFLSGNPRQISRVPVFIKVLDVNDNAPEFAMFYETFVCENVKAGQVYLRSIRLSASSSISLIGQWMRNEYSINNTNQLINTEGKIILVICIVRKEKS